MYFEDIPFYTVFPEVEKCVTKIVLSASDSAEFLGGEGYGLENVCDLHGTKYEDMIPAFVSCKPGESWGMRGTLFRFKLTDAVKKHIQEESIIGMFNETDPDRLYLENLTLFDGERIVFSCISHEVFSLYHMAEVDDSLSEQILSAVDSTIKNMPPYGTMSKIAARLKKKTKREIGKELWILSDLCWYVDEEKGRWVYSEPKYKCVFSTFKKIAKSYLTEETYEVLSPLHSFSDLQPLPVAKTADDVMKGVGKDTPQYLQSEYYRAVKRELNMLKIILGISTREEVQ